MSSKAIYTTALLSKAVQVEKVDDGVYKVDLDWDFCIGGIPNGGYAASCILSAGSDFLSSRQQPDLLTAHVEYPNRAVPGPGLVIIKSVKIGRTVSLIHLTLYQDELLDEAPWIGASPRPILLAYASYTKLDAVTGLSVPTLYGSSSAAALPHLPDREALIKYGQDANWKEELPSGAPLLQSVERLQFYLPRYKLFTLNALDMWVRLRSGENIVQKALPFVSDAFPHSIHSWLVAPEWKARMKPPNYDEDGNIVDAPAGEEQNEERGYPTLTMNIEVKGVLPPQGVEWLHVRISTKLMKNGMADFEFIISDDQGSIIALAQHVFMIIDSGRNARRKNIKASM
ncbi:hypothetical protein NQ176_g3057 [Zarea fungicola]|uniref:Uncharacterized protein n=1 Tax=Zarea fungicola TaxID=93591 RepID=A0ACC1NN24_9HYPO|nr:hypothetical protein NQ176_g3057 [Lecanicillium fungicola]